MTLNDDQYITGQGKRRIEMHTRVDDEKVLQLENELQRVHQADAAEHDERPFAFLRVVVLEGDQKVTLRLALPVERQIRGRVMMVVVREVGR